MERPQFREYATVRREEVKEHDRGRNRQKVSPLEPFTGKDGRDGEQHHLERAHDEVLLKQIRRQHQYPRDQECSGAEMAQHPTVLATETHAPANRA